MTIELDFYEIDSWDFENFNIYIDDVQVISNEFKHNREDFSLSPAMSASSLIFAGDDGDVDYGFIAAWPDQGFHYSLTHNTTSSTLKLGFGSSLDSPITDESWGVDNIVITDDLTVVPLPGAVWLLASGIAGIAATRMRRRTK